MRVVRIAAILSEFGISELAADLHLSERAVRHHLPEAISKRGARKRVEPARIARAKGWL